METIVHQITEELSKKILNLIKNNGLRDISWFASEALDCCKESVGELIVSAVGQLNEEVRADKGFRKEQGLVLKEKDRPRSIFTDVGMIDFKRDYFWSKVEGTYLYPVDTMIGLEPYARIGDEISAKLVAQAGEVSYEKSAVFVTEGKISKQTVKNKLCQIGKLETPIPKEKRIVKELHIFADEDHVAMQKGNNKMVPLVTVTEGIHAVGKNRNELKQAVHFTDKITETKQLWETVAGYISGAYEEREIERIYLHGDGAPWIKQGLEEWACCHFVIDGFHFEKHLKRVTGSFPGQSYSFRIRQAIIKKDASKASQLVLEMIRQAEGPAQEKRIRKFRSYLKNNWEGIVRRYTGGILGSCTEALVSHVYSERLSRNPMGWSEKGLEKMAELRVYTRNGCKVSASAFRRTDEEKNRSLLKEYGQERLRNAISGCKDWSIFEKEQYIPAINTGTQVLIRSYGKQRSLVG